MPQEKNDTDQYRNIRHNEDPVSHSGSEPIRSTSEFEARDSAGATDNAALDKSSSHPAPPSDPTTISSKYEGLITGGGTTGVNTAGTTQPDKDALPTGSNPFHSDAPHFTVERPTEAEQPQRGTHAGGFSVADTSVSARPDSGVPLHQKHQGADRPMEDPSGNEGAEEAIRRKKEQAEEAMTRSTESAQYGGEQQHSKHGLTGPVDPDGEQRPSEGTGQKYVKSTGVAAMGGNFDATKPGAGREDERLLEEQGVHRDHRDTTRTSIAAAAHAGDGSKRSIGDKIKEKLHTSGH